MDLPHTIIEKIKERFDILTSAWHNSTPLPVVSIYWLSREDDQVGHYHFIQTGFLHRQSRQDSPRLSSFKVH